MRKLRAWLLRTWGQFRRTPDHEFTEEIETHLQMQIEDNLRSGMEATEARRQALVKSGGMETTMQAYREGSSLPFVETLYQDLRYTIRQLRKNPGFAATAILVLTLGIGAMVAIFSFADAALIKPLPYRQPSRLMVIFGSTPLGQRFHLSFPDYYDFKKLNQVFSSFDVYDPNGFVLSTPGGAQLAPGARVSAGFFRTLGVAPILGRDFSQGEDTPAGPRTVLLSYAAWRNRYGMSPAVLGQTVTLDGNPNTIVGVLPRDFHFAPAEPAEFWTAEHDESPCRGCHWLFGIARLKDGVSIEMATANVTAISRQLEAQYPDSNRSQSEAVIALPDVIVGDIRPILLMLLGGAGLLLVIASVNVASLLLVRTQSRKREIAVRGALGATRRRLLRQFVTEGLVLSACGSVIGLTAADGAMHLLTRLIPADTLASMPYLQGLGLSPHVLLFTLAVAFFSVAIFSFTPIISMSREEMRAGLTEGSRGASGTVWHKFGANLVVIELATAVVLLVGAGLLGKSFYRLLQVDPGLQPGNLATLPLSIPRANYSKDPQVLALERRILDRVSVLPGVSSVAITNKLPVGDGDFTTSFVIVDQPKPDQNNEVAYRIVSTDYFKTLQARLLKGRYFNAGEDSTKPRVALINHALASRYFHGEQPVGMFINYDGAPADQAMQIVGVIDDIREGPLDTDARAAFYVPFDQHPISFFSIVARTSARSAVDVAGADFDDAADRSGHCCVCTGDHGAAYTRFGAGLPASRVGVAGGEFCGSGAAAERGGAVWRDRLFGEPAYAGNRSQDGAGSAKGNGLSADSEAGHAFDRGGNFCRASGAIVAASLMRNLLFGTQVWDGFTLASVSLVLGASALLASYLPARRAASVNPLDALRAE